MHSLTHTQTHWNSLGFTFVNTLRVRGEVTPTSSGSSIYSYICADNTQLSFDREQSWHEMVRAAVDTKRENLRGVCVDALQSKSLAIAK